MSTEIAPTVTLRRIPNPMGEERRVAGRSRTETLPTPLYEVLVDGETVGTVERCTFTRETGPVQRRYVSRRWESLGWASHGSGRLRNGYGIDHGTRRRAVADVLAAALNLSSMWDAEKIAATAKVEA